MPRINYPVCGYKYLNRKRFFVTVSSWWTWQRLNDREFLRVNRQE